MKPKLTLTLILFLTLNACEKNDSPTFFQGIVTEHNTDVPLPNVLIKLNRNDAYTGLAPNFFANVVIDTTRTDNNGFYKFSFDQDDKLLYRVSAFLPNYIKVENWMTPEPIATFIQKMSVNSDTFVLGKSATLKLNLSNTTHNFDRISLSCRSYLSDSTNLYISEYNKLYAYMNVVDSTELILDFLYKDNLKAALSWTLRKDTLVYKHHRDTELILMDTTYLTIEF